ncbi:hypothetical protein [Cohnella cellulosilytica]|uniref:Transposase/invertase (TIGR01784 family) n=1 Tax=Cohnella cellulosilytica TaxID=986710 RepID=A0ABW2F7B4_9BACL
MSKILLTYSYKWSAERQFRSLLANEEMFGAELLNFEYLFIDVARYTEDELLSLSNTIGSVFLLDQTEDRQQLLNRLGKLMGTIQRMPEDSQQKFMAWMANIFLQKLPENEPNVQQLIQNMKGDAKNMSLEKVLDDIEREGELRGELRGKLEGRLEGKMEGELKGKEQVAKRMIEERLDPDLISRVTGFSLDKIDQLRKDEQSGTE